MFQNDKIIINDITFANHLVGNSKGSHTEYKTKDINHYQLLYKLKGEAIITFDKKTVTEKEDDLRFLPNPSIFSYSPTYTADVIEEGESINIGFITETSLPKEIMVKKYNCHPMLKELFQKLQKCWYYKKDGYYMKSLSILYEILSAITEAESKYLSSKIYNKILPATDYIDSHFTDTDINCEYLASLCGISHTYMTELFRKHLGMSPNKYIIYKKLQYACDLLNTRQYSINKIAQKTGFSNVYYFSRVFKKHYGVCPSDFYNKDPEI